MHRPNQNYHGRIVSHSYPSESRLTCNPSCQRPPKVPAHTFLSKVCSPLSMVSLLISHVSYSLSLSITGD
eukprot:c23959_g3_i1 orf=391-600(-)